MIYMENVRLREIGAVLNRFPLIIFGAGKMAIKTLDCINETYPDYDFSRILYFVDNDVNKWGSTFQYKENAYRIISLKDIACDIRDKVAIIVSTIYSDEILEQLANNDDFINTHVICYSDIPYAKIMDDFYLPKSLKMTEYPIIPKVIHYCWFGRAKIPDKYREWMKTWAKYCPDYEIVEWNDDNYDYKKNEYMYEAYKANQWAFVSDYARMDVVYNYGGIYLDTDVELIRNIDVLLYQKAFMGLQNDLRIATGLGFGAIKRHHTIGEFILEYEDRKFLLPDGGYDLTPCPSIQTPFLEKKGYKRENKYQVVDDIAILPAPVLGGYIGEHLVVNEDVYMLHHYAASWISPERRVVEGMLRMKREANLRKFRERYSQ